MGMWATKLARGGASGLAMLATMKATLVVEGLEELTTTGKRGIDRRRAIYQKNWS